jgi:hypothetical protein
MLGDNTVGRAVMLRPIWFQCVGIWSPTGLRYIYPTYVNCRPSNERTNRASGWSDNADCPVLRNYVYIYIYIYIFFPMARQPLGGPRPPSFYDASRSHTLDTPHSVGLLWTKDQLVAETST